MGTGAAFWFNSYPAGPWIVAAGFCVLLVHAVRLVRHRDRRVGAPALQQEGRHVVPLEHELVHLQRGDVLRGVLRRAVLHPQRVGARSRQRIDRALLWPDYAAQWPTVGPYIQQAFSPMAAIGIPLLNTIILVTLRRHADARAPRAEGRAPRRAQVLAVHHDRARLHVPGLPGVRVHARVQRAQPQALDGRLRLDVLHADRLPRLPRDDRRDHADA